MKIAVTGASGTVGSELVSRGCFPIDCNILDSRYLEKKIHEINPDLVIHCAAITSVDQCEKNFQLAYDVNVKGALNVADCCKRMIYISTDHVFSGNHGRVYVEYDDPNPVNVYGFTKWSGEIVSASANISGCDVLVVRTSRLYNLDYVQRMINILKDENIIRFEETGLIKRSFLYLPLFVDALLDIANHLFDKIPQYEKPEYWARVLHYSGAESISYYEFWKQVAQTWDLPYEKLEERKYELLDAIPRPYNGGLNINIATKRLKLLSHTVRQQLWEIKENES